jgi:hypothetical protein
MRRPIVIARKTFSAFHFALFAFFVLSLFGSPAYGQRKDKNETIEHPNGLVQDWSHHHAVYPRVGPLQSLLVVQNNPRAIHSWQAAARANWHRTNNPKSHNGKQTAFHRDWSISLGTGTTAQSMFPAKFGFDVNAAPDCANDFIVYPVNTIGGAGQPNIVGFNNLYSGTAGSTGICNAPLQGRTAGVNDDGFSATTMWSYDIHAAGGIVATSPALSLDGTKIAFVETKFAGVGNAAHFHVLAWKSGDGVAANLQAVTSAVTINTFSTTTPAAGAATDLALGTTDDDTLSSPFIEYGLDMAYVGNDAGTLFRIKNVFCTFPQCTGAGSPAPSLDTSWGIAGALGTGCSGKLTGPVVDGSTGNVFVGCSDGKLYGFTSAGAGLTNSPLTVGDGTATGGIVDPPIVDGVNGLVYAVSGSAAGGTSVLVQAKTADLSAKVTATLGTAGSSNLHAPAFNDAYFSSGTSANWLLYEVTPNSSIAGITVYGIAFNGSRVMTSGTPANADNFAIGTSEISPLTEFLTSGGEDRFFESVLNPGNLASYNITTTFPTTFEHNVSEGNGTTGIVVDNGSASNQADSIYFGVLGSNTAVKLTQSDLQ